MSTAGAPLARDFWAVASPAGWLHSRAFDVGLIGGVLVFALGLGCLANAGAGWFAAVLWIDFWLIAYPHVAAMWTRVAFDRANARRYWFLWTGLPPLVLLGTAGLANWGGALALNTLYYHWQSYHYTRQSYGIARAYQRAGEAARALGTQHRPKSPEGLDLEPGWPQPAPFQVEGDGLRNGAKTPPIRARGSPSARIGVTGRDWLTDSVVFVFPIWGWLHRCAQGHTNFFGGALWLPAVPELLASAIGGVAGFLLVIWGIRARWETGHAWFVLSHVLLTFVSYVAVNEITRGWIFVNIWHNAQYVLFVWASNVRRFAGQGGAAPRTLAWLCQPANWKMYALVCFALSTAGFALLGATVEGFAAIGIGASLVIYQTLNFHHYVVDAVIWRSPAARGV